MINRMSKRVRGLMQRTYGSILLRQRQAQRTVTRNTAADSAAEFDGAFETLEPRVLLSGAPLDVVDGFNDGQQALVVLEGEGDGYGDIQGVNNALLFFEQRSSVGTGPVSVATGDFNGDEIPDLVVANALSDDVSILLGNGNGTFGLEQRFAAGDRPQSVATGDLNGDGFTDVVTANQDDDTVSVLLGNGDGTFAPQQTFAVGDSPVSVVIADLNGDEALDLITANQNSNDVSVLLGDGAGSFAAAQSFAVGDTPQSVAVADDGYGAPDLVVANALSDDFSVLYGNGDGTFAPQQTFDAGDRPQSVTIGDFNGDWVLDLAVANQDSFNVSVLLDDGNDSLTEQQTFPVGDAPHAVTHADINNDGVTDLITANQNTDNVSVLLGMGDGTFFAHQTFAVGDTPRDVLAVDLNGDGAIDLVTANRFSDDISVLLNQFTRTVSISRAEIVEGDEGTTTLDFTVELSSASGLEISVLVNTADFTATAGEDYTALVDYLLTFAPGETEKTVSVDISGDTDFESNERFTTSLSQPTGAIIDEGQAFGTIFNDDPEPLPDIELDVLGNDTEIEDGDVTPDAEDHTDFGGAQITDASVTRTFTIRNTGEDTLNLTNFPAVQIIGANAGDFQVIQQPATVIGGGGETTFMIRFDPSAEGIRTATVVINNTDADESPYNFDIQGEGTPNVELSFVIGDGGLEQLSWIDDDGTLATLSTKGSTTTVTFIGYRLAETFGDKGPVIVGDEVSQVMLYVTPTAEKTDLMFKADGGADDAVEVYSIETEGHLNKVKGRQVMLTNMLWADGAINKLDLYSVAGETNAMSINKLNVMTDFTGNLTLGYGELNVQAVDEGEGEVEDSDSVLLNRAKIGGDVADGMWRIFGGMKHLKVGDTLRDVEIRTDMDINRVKALGMQSAAIYAGVDDEVTGVPDDFTDFVYTSTIGKVTLTEMFTDSVLGARNIDVAKLGAVQLGNEGMEHGIGTSVLGRLRAWDAATGTSIKLASIDNAGELAGILAGLGIDLGDFKLIIA